LIFIKNLSVYPIDALKKYYRDKKFTGIIVSYTTSDQKIKILKNLGYKIYASFPVFMSKNIWKMHPETRPVDKNGILVKWSGWYYGINPHIEWLRKQKLSSIDKIANNTLFDGIFLDFIRYPIYWESPNPKYIETGFDKIALNLFLKKNYKSLADGREKILKKYLSQWRRWKEQNITTFIRKSKEIVNRRGKKLGVFLVPYLPDNHMKKYVNQEYSEIKKYCDFCSPMLFYKMIKKNKSWLIKLDNRYLKLFKKKYFPVHQSFSLQKKELSGFLTQLKKNKSSYILFHGEGLIKILGTKIP
jgi:hypothetical protein